MTILSERGVAYALPIATSSSNPLAPPSSRPVPHDPPLAAHPLRRSPADVSRSSNGRTAQMAITQERAVYDATPTCSMYAGAEGIVSRAAARSHKEHTRANDLRLARAPTQERGEGLGRAHCADLCADSPCLNTTTATLSRPHQSSLTPPPQSHRRRPIHAQPPFCSTRPSTRCPNTTTTFRGGMALEESPITDHVRLTRPPAAFDPACSVVTGHEQEGGDGLHRVRADLMPATHASPGRHLPATSRPSSYIPD
ncbi:uncharacterized protein SCHCODRAFT_02671593 [Schizophyllum commune H4-8]|uniref:uncharacterized protein n=1 Tax=Schizophyllum commune (strain H4-8 / FGSC 9210) TaxID=578458 RepID=UPI00215EFE0C|nr:uncharacterized protein SCHCODRAFT_02671593 [Schizophyllum commune H4-8]KAI5887600.1 hypothetical protein SCHCODRAFT_02671593 [Schizophyllum commune H4-8]